MTATNKPDAATKRAARTAERRAYISPKFAPGGVVVVRPKLGDAEAFVWTDERGQLRALGFLGNARNPWSRSARIGGAYIFKTAETRAHWVADLFKVAASVAEYRGKRSAEKAAARAAGHSLQVGDVLRSSWGYDQTNIDYFQVTRLIGSTMVEVREIGSQREQTGSMQGTCVPSPGQFIGQPQRCRVSGESVRISSCQTASLEKPAAVVAGVPMYSASHWTAYA